MGYRALYLLYMVILVGCTSQAPVEYTMPVNYETQSFEVEHANGFDVEIVEVLSGPEPVDTQEQWRAWREDLEAKDKLKMMNAVYEKENQPFRVLEEKRIEQFCKDEGFRACKNIDRTCEKIGCYEVTIECDDDFYNPKTDTLEECQRFEVEVSDNINKELTKAVEAEECD